VEVQIVDYLVELPQEIGLNADEFVHLWNGQEELTKVATARMVENDEGRYDAGVFTVPVILGTVGIHIIAASIYDGLRELFKERGIKAETDFRMVEKPDGTRIIRIRTKKG
jgi:hypothetical protein